MTDKKEVTYDLTNTMGHLLDVETLDGPMLLLGYGKLEGVRLDALQRHVLETSAFVEIVETPAAAQGSAGAKAGTEASTGGKKAEGDSAASAGNSGKAAAASEAKSGDKKDK